MSELYYLEIEIPNVDFDLYFFKGKKIVSQRFEAQLSTKEDKIEIKIFYDDQTYFGEKLMNWLHEISWEKFGSYLHTKLKNHYAKERLQKIDLSHSKLVGTTNSTNFYENGYKYTVLRFDSVKFYWDPIEDDNLTGEFYLDDKGFRVLEPFYSFFSPTSPTKNDGKIDIGRMNGTKYFYKLEKSSFRPEYNFFIKDNRKERVATIIKEPKIQFRYKKEITEQEAIFYGDVVLMLASFFHHIKIDYILRRIHLPSSTITIRNIEEKNFFNTSGNLWAFGIYWEFNKFLQSSWQKQTLKNYNLLSKTISLFNQSHLVDNFSSFLIRYNIIEICDKQKESKEKFTRILNRKHRRIKQDEALSLLLETIKPDEHEAFKTRWANVQALLQNKPMKNQLLIFLESQNIETSSLPISIKELKEMRDLITHGSIDKVCIEKLNKANTLLYRISGILILNLMGINEWKLNTKIK